LARIEWIVNVSPVGVDVHAPAKGLAPAREFPRKVVHFGCGELGFLGAFVIFAGVGERIVIELEVGAADSWKLDAGGSGFGCQSEGGVVGSGSETREYCEGGPSGWRQSELVILGFVAACSVA
jgi:hypothetical protein